MHCIITALPSLPSPFPPLSLLPSPHPGSRAPVPRTSTQHNGVSSAHPLPPPFPTPLPSDSPMLSHASSIDLPQTRKMIVLQDFSSDDPSCLAIKKGESVQVMKHEGDMALVRNERGKEGFMPKTNLFAPYSNRRQARGSIGSKTSLLCDSSEAGSDQHPPHPLQQHRPVPMFHVASGSSLLSQRSPPAEGGKSPSTSSSNRVSLEGEQGSSPPPHGVALGTSPESNGASSSSEVVQKHSPSSSSGVASSVGSQNHHQNHQHNNHHQEHQVHNGAPVQEQRSSFSSLEDDVLVATGNNGQPPPPPPQNLYRNRVSPLTSMAGVEKRNANASSDETLSRGTNSPSLSTGVGGSAVHRPLPPPPITTTTTTMTAPSQVVRSNSPRTSNGRTIRESDQTPPPIPPRDVFINKVPSPREGDYSSPADALHPNASHQERLAHYQRERGGNRGGDGGRVRSSTMYRSKPYNRQAPTTAGGNFEADFLPPGGASEVQTRRPVQSGRRRFSEDPEATKDKTYTDSSSTPASSVNGDVFVTNQGKISKFKKSLWGLFVVATDFGAGDENEISVSKGEHISVWNRDDPDWFWVVRHTSGNEEGFVPSCCLREMATNDAKHPRKCAE